MCHADRAVTKQFLFTEPDTENISRHECLPSTHEIASAGQCQPASSLFFLKSKNGSTREFYSERKRSCLHGLYLHDNHSKCFNVLVNPVHKGLVQLLSCHHVHHIQLIRYT